MIYTNKLLQWKRQKKQKQNVLANVRKDFEELSRRHKGSNIFTCGVTVHILYTTRASSSSIVGDARDWNVKSSSTPVGPLPRARGRTLVGGMTWPHEKVRTGTCPEPSKLSCCCRGPEARKVPNLDAKLHDESKKEGLFFSLIPLVILDAEYMVLLAHSRVRGIFAISCCSM